MLVQGVTYHPAILNYLDLTIIFVVFTIFLISIRKRKIIIMNKYRIATLTYLTMYIKIFFIINYEKYTIKSFKEVF